LRDIPKEHDAEVAALKQEFDEDENFISANEAARVLNVSLTTLWRWTKSGLVKGIKVGNHVRYCLSEINSVKKGGKL
ncbi:MAG: helix-turn-helix domain-containing protein, partial [Prevotella sp.]|nr:helix-turn-helix domain-containing protein [Prevotella sp.]